MFKNLLSLYHYQYPKALISLVIRNHFKAKEYLKQLHQTKNFKLVLKNWPKHSKSYLTEVILLSLGMLLQIVTGLVLIVLDLTHHFAGGIYFGLALILLYPFVWAYLLALGLIIRNRYLIEAKD